MIFLDEETWRLYQTQGWLRLDEQYLFALGFHCPSCSRMTFNKYVVGSHMCREYKAGYEW